MSRGASPVLRENWLPASPLCPQAEWGHPVSSPPSRVTVPSDGLWGRPAQTHWRRRHGAPSIPMLGGLGQAALLLEAVAPLVTPLFPVGHSHSQSPRCPAVLLRSMEFPYRAVQPQRYHHQEEYDGKEGGSHHVGDCFGVGDKKEARP